MNSPHMAIGTSNTSFLGTSVYTIPRIVSHELPENLNVINTNCLTLKI